MSISGDRWMASLSPEERRQKRLEYKHRWRDKNPENYVRLGRKYYLKRKYDLEVDEYDALVQAQSGRCAICAEPEERLHIDHDHTTGIVRGLLCSRCNRGLGHFRDSAENLEEAIRYLGFAQ